MIRKETNLVTAVSRHFLSFFETNFTSFLAQGITTGVIVTQTTGVCVVKKAQGSTSLLA